MNWETSVWPDGEALSQAVAREVAGVAAAALRDHGRFDLVLAGGHTPERLYQILATDYRHSIDWGRTHLFWGDERYVATLDQAARG
jgi:6-phosphogluconolactonase